MKLVILYSLVLVLAAMGLSSCGQNDPMLPVGSQPTPSVSSPVNSTPVSVPETTPKPSPSPNPTPSVTPSPTPSPVPVPCHKHNNKCEVGHDHK